MRMPRKCLSPQVDEFIIKSTGGQVYNKVHKVDKLRSVSSLESLHRQDILIGS